MHQDALIYSSIAKHNRTSVIKIQRFILEKRTASLYSFETFSWSNESHILYNQSTFDL